jgi:uncharacterized protein YlaN (UPF0358 family)
MKKNIFTVIVFLFTSVFSSTAGDFIYSLDSGTSLAWKVYPVSTAGTNVATLSSPDYNPSEWIPAQVPGTFFVDYVNAGLELNPDYGDNIYNVDESKYNKPFWYRLEFTVPQSFTKDKIQLNFEGINKKATVYLNGQSLGIIKGHVQRAKYDISAIASRTGNNILLVRIDIPNQRNHREQQGFDVFANYAMPTYMASAGWDWMPYVPGLNCGITNDVYLSNSGTVTLDDPWVRTDLPSKTLAHLSVQTQLKNTDSQPVSGQLQGTIQPGNIQFTKAITLPANTEENIVLDKNEFSQLTINNPELWWPRGYGEQALYTCTLTFTVDNVVSDEQTVSFGIKKYEYNTENTSLTFYVNGEKILLRGGNWGMSEYLLRCHGEEYRTKIKLHADMNYNMIRCWTGCVTDEEFYQYCDEFGIMVWDDFWLATGIGLPDDVNEFRSNATDKVKRLRNHPCLALWCGANESLPPGTLDNDLRSIIAQYDGNDRRYQPNSRKGGGLTGSGYWNNFAARDYFREGIPSWGGDFGDGNKKWGMRTELGMATFTTFESFKEFIPQADWWPSNWKTNEMWNKHFFGELAPAANPESYFNAVKKNYGVSTDIENFCERSQFLNLEIMKAIYEGWNDHLWNDATGILIWMSHPAYPSFVWQTYDYYYDATGAYWGAKKACEPLHIQWNCSNNSVKVINTTVQNYTNLKAKATVYNLDGSIYEPLSTEKTLNVLSKEAKECFILSTSGENLALQKTAYSSGNDDPSRDSSKAVDGDISTRWASNYDDNAWIYVDLGEPKEFDRISLSWEGAYGKQFIIQVSNDASEWTNVYTQGAGNGGTESITFNKTTARYVKLQGVKRATQWGYSLYEFQVFASPDTGNQSVLSDVNFIRLELRDNQNNVVSDNFYWRNVTNADDYTALNTLPQANLSTNETSRHENGQYIIDYQITNNSSTVAFGIRLRVIDEQTGKRILPIFMKENYFTLMPGETKDLQIQFDESLTGNHNAGVLLKQYGQSEITTGIKEIASGKVKPVLNVYPNPATDWLYLNGDKAFHSVKIVDINSRIVYSGNNESEINISRLAKGFYLLQAIRGNEVYTTKWIKK